ncbi:EamA-like transporter family protein [Runella rosea]|uniref:EamA-like transporter family protein n=1 Tax=Runella rosea TaxID=2259595 RepID=A0A344TJN1_9BACT|nr:DMT family transporter [Runella rosea]AXE18852.1 EamA-like transporter family protein [Runella rosea]
MHYFFLLLAFLIGVTNTFQSGVNSQLRLATQNPILSSILSFATGLCVLLVCYLLFNKDAIPSFETFRSISWWKWLGGVFGAFYVLTVILIVKEIGPANLLCLIIAGQLVAGVLIDHFGWVGFAVHPMNIWRIFGIGLIILGGVLVLKN